MIQLGYSIKSGAHVKNHLIRAGWNKNRLSLVYATRSENNLNINVKRAPNDGAHRKRAWEVFYTNNF